MADIYRSAASILVLRPGPDGDHFEILLLHKPRKNDSWQLPQGGVEEGETICEAALRELQEEASLTGCRVLTESSCIYAYDFPQSFRKWRPDNVKGQRISFVTALAPPHPDICVDGKEVDAYKWVSLSEVSQSIKRKEYLDLIHMLYDEAVREMQRS